MSSSADLTHYTLSIATFEKTFTPSTIKGIIQPRGNNINNLPLGNYAKYAYTLFTRAATSIGAVAGVIKEGDRIHDPTSNKLFEVLNVEPYYITNSFSHYICELLELQQATFRKATAGGSDSITGWTTITYGSPATVYVNFSPKNSISQYTPFGGYYANNEYTAVMSTVTYDPAHSTYGATTLSEGDRLQMHDDVGTTGGGFYYEVTAITEYPSRRGENFKYIIASLQSVGTGYYGYGVRPAASGASYWHLDSDSVTTDPRSRIKTWLNTYLAARTVPNDSGTPLTYDKIFVFSGFPYPLLIHFSAQNLKLLHIIDKSETTALYTKEKVPYGFIESVPVTILAREDYNGLTTATRILEYAEQKIRDAATDYPLTGGTIRRINKIKHDSMMVGQQKVWYTTLTIEYERPNDDYTPTYPTVTWGPSASPTGTYTIPNVTDLKITMLSNNKRLTVPGRLGQWTQKLGLPDLQIDISSDLDIEPWSGVVSDTKISWKRPQTTGTKTDIKKWQVFADIQFNGELTGQTYQTLNLGYGTTMQVILDEVHIDENNGGHTLMLRFFGYNSVSATNYKTWFSINP